MKQRAKLHPWQFSLRFLLAVTALVAVAAAFFGWRERQLGPQRRAVARIVELGGLVEVERRGWAEAIWQGGDFEAAISVTLPGHLADEALPDLQQCRSLRTLTLTYTVAYGAFGRVPDFDGDVFWYTNTKEDRWKHFFIGNSFVMAGSEDTRSDRCRLALRNADLHMSEKLDDTYANYLASFAAKR